MKKMIQNDTHLIQNDTFKCDIMVSLRNLYKGIANDGGAFFSFSLPCSNLLTWWAFRLQQKRKGDIVSGFTYKQQYAVVVICKDEQEQESVYNRLNEEGYKLKVVAV